MIKAAGYTDDGCVFFIIGAVIKGEEGDLTVQMTPYNAQKFINDLQEALKQAPAYAPRTMQ